MTSYKKRGVIKIDKYKKICFFIVIILIILVLLIIFLHRNNNNTKIQENFLKMEDNIEVTYIKTKTSKEKVSILITIQADAGLSKVIRPDLEEINVEDGRRKIAIDYTMDYNTDHLFKVIDNNGNYIEKIINIKLGEIYTIEDLEEINYDILNDLTQNFTYTLMRNLDFKDRDSYRTQERYEYYNKDNNGDGIPDNSWTTLGISSTSKTFQGTFNGDYHKIKNLCIHSGNSGLIYYTHQYATIKKLVLEDVYVEAGDGNGCSALVCRCYKGTIEECGVTGKIVNNFGGATSAISRSWQYTNISRCFARIDFTLSITNSINAGLLVPQAQSTDSAGIICSNCYTSGIIRKYGYGIGKSHPSLGMKAFDKCYSTVSFDDTNSNNNIAPLGNGNFTNSFWSSEVSDIDSNSIANNLRKGTNITETQMKTESTFTSAGWDFNTVWQMNPTTGYPRLQWENNIKD